ncbi:MAG: helix-turn-helix transcriptional regulator [Clostridiales bacterium]|nr:helix-turn-helix transcriptional regulator [Clostridiales bacterium]
MKIKELTGLSKSTISEIENDKSSPTTATLEKIAKALDVSITDFFKKKLITN